jgi:protein-tyrosine phosphatase/nicotinamidase-related amidase
VTDSILITQCLQNDFVKPLGKYSPLPNLLHIGYLESKRLMGEKPEEGPVAKIMEWAYGQSETELDIIHIRDWHDASDPLQTSHLKQFNEHCLKDTDGAEFIFNNELLNKRESRKIVNALTLNDFQGTNLETFLEPYKEKPVKIGLIGVWTEAKILFLTYELVTRYPNFQIGICSALTASSSVAQHFVALEQLEKLLGVKVFSSIGRFIEFLGGEPLEIPLPFVNRYGLEIELNGGAPFSETDERLIRYLFRDCQKVSFKTLAGGFSGNVVLGSQSTDMFGHSQVPHVVKIGAQEGIGHERASFERIEPVLGNVSPHIADFADLGSRGAIKYRYASMGGGFSTTFQKLYQEIPVDRIKRILDIVFVEQLGRFYAAGKPESSNLLEHYLFSPKWADSVRKKVELLIEKPAAGKTLLLPGGRECSNLCLFYEEQLINIPNNRRDTSIFSYVHGDLNGANIIIDSHDNVWLIDFFHTSRGHILKDLIKLENDLLYIFTEINSPEEFAEALELTDILLSIEDLANPLSDIVKFKNPAISKAYETIKILRGYYHSLIEIYRNPLQVFIGQMRYAVHTLSFDESSKWQKLWALYTAAKCGDKIINYLKKTQTLRIDWLEQKYTGSGRLGLTILPGRRDYDRELADDINLLKKENVSAIICLLTNNEFQHYGVDNLLMEYRNAGMEVRHLPIIDQGVCTTQDMQELLQWISEKLNNGAKIVVHCAGGLGRSGTVLACYLRKTGLNAEDSMVEVRRVRSPRAIESKVQEEFIYSI